MVVEEWEFDKELKNVIGFNWIIYVINHFSKSLMSIPEKNNNAKNILVCLKQFVNYIGLKKIFFPIIQ